MGIIIKMLSNYTLEIFLTSLLLVLGTVAYVFWLKPVKLMKFYAKFLRRQGYTVYEIPYNPFKTYFVETITQGANEGDPMKVYKERGAKYDVIVSNMHRTPLLQFNNPDFIKDYYAVDKHFQYPKEKKMVTAFARATGYGLPFSEGEIWKRKRSIINKIFNFDFTKSQTIKISKVCSRSLKEIESKSKRDIEKNTVTYNIVDLNMKIFSATFTEIFLGGPQGQIIMGQSAGEFIKKMFDDMAIQFYRPLNFYLGVKFMNLGITQEQREILKRVKEYRNWGQQFIKERVKQITKKIQSGEENPESQDIVQAFLRANISASQNQKKDDASLKEEILEQISSFFIAGTDSTSTFTQLMIYLIAIYPEIEKKVRQQIETYMKEEDYSYENLKKFHYIDLLQKQTSRYYGPGTHIFDRQASCDNYLNGLPIKKGTAISIMHFGNHFSEKYFKKPYEFRPERWESQCSQIPSFVIGGFNAGARVCVGKYLAHFQSKIVIIKFLKRYKKIILPVNEIKMDYRFIYSPEDFETTCVIDENYQL